MAIYSFNRKIVTRTSKDGRVQNAVFAAAYYRAEKRTCHKTQECKDFTSKKSQVIYKDCLLPSDAPEWATKLRNAHVPDENGQYSHDKTGEIFSDYAWNLLEHIEKRYDSQLYIREIIAIPIELNQEQAIELAREFAQNCLAVNGTFCEIAIHWDLINPHIHYMRPAFRALTGEGFSKKVRLTRAELEADLKKHRELWSEHANSKLAIAGYEVRIDHRSYKDRGIDLLPTVKIGKATYMAGTEHQELRIAENQRIRAENYKKIEASPEILVKKLGQEHQFLVKEDVHNELSRYVVNEQVLEKIEQEKTASCQKIVRSIIDVLKSERTVFNERHLKEEMLKLTDNNEDYQQIINKILASENIYNLGLGEDGRNYYVTREVFQLELGMIQDAEKLNKKSTFLVSLSDIKKYAKQYNLNEGQQLALKYITQGNNIALVRGMAGTGKTYMLKPAKEIWERAGYRVYGVAFLGRAAAGLESDSGINSKTIDRFLSAIRKGYIKLGNKDIIVMDEAGMTSLDHAHTLIKLANEAGAKLVALGDIEQTQSTQRGASFKALLDTVGCVVLDEIIRQKIDWQAEATLNMEMQNTGKGLDVYNEHKQVAFTETSADAINLVVQQWFDQWQSDQDNLKNHIITAFKNETVETLNLHARAKLVEKGLLNKGTDFKTSTDSKFFIAIGERIVFTKNDYQMNVKNGDFGIVEKIDDKMLSVRLDNGTLKEFSIDQYNHINYGYAATIHKLQGYTGNHTQLYVDSRGFDRHLFLVGASRHRYNLSIITDHENFKDYNDLKEIVSREGLKDYIFDFPAAFAIRRGFNEKRITQRTVEFVRKAKQKVQDSMLWLLNYQETAEQDPFADVKIRRQRARTVADFCDRRIEIAQNVADLLAMPGVSLSIAYQTPPQDADVLDKTLSLYLESDTIYFAVRNASGEVERIALPNEKFTSDQQLTNIKNVLYDNEEIDKLTPEDEEAQFNTLAEYGYTSIDEAEKIERQRYIYQSQLENSVLARVIKKNYGNLQVAIDRNRISRQVIEKSIEFADRHDEMKAVAKEYKLKQFYAPMYADQIMKDFGLYYSHMISAMGNGKELNEFINSLKHQAYQYRYETAFKAMDIEMRPLIKVVKRYLDLDYEVTKILVDKENALDEMKKRLHELTVERNKLANQIFSNSEEYQLVIAHFDVELRRVKIHQAGHNARELVKRFSEMQSTSADNTNLHKQLLARQIKSRPKRYGAYVHEFLNNNWKQINLENWYFKNRHVLLTQNNAFKESYRLVRRYFGAISSSSKSWKNALKRRDLQSKNTNKFIRRAQAWSVQRDCLASLIVSNLESHAGAIGFERVDLAKLMAQARSYEFMQRYLHEKNEIKKLTMAHYIVSNMRSFSHLAEHYYVQQDIRERAQHHRYLQSLNRAPTLEIKEFIRLNEHYKQKRYEAGQYFRIHKQLETVGKSNGSTLHQAKHLTYQRNQAAFDLLAQAAKSQLLELCIEGISLDAAVLEKQAKQHIAYQRVIAYLNAHQDTRGKLADELLKDRACYHFIYDKEISFDTLRQEARAWLSGQTLEIKIPTTKTIDLKRWNFEAISSALIANPEDTYLTILGEPKKRTAREWRYEDGLIITLKGSNAGKWYSFTEGKGGGPIKAIEQFLGLNFSDALQHGAKIAGLTDSQAMTTETVQIISSNTQNSLEKRQQQEALERQRRIESAQSIWNSTEDITNTLAEHYFNEHRKIDDIKNMQFRYWPEGAAWFDYDDSGKKINKINKVPAAVLAVKDAENTITAVQRIYLDKFTANKNTFMDNAKLSKGVMQGSAGIIQVGDTNGRVYLVEGPETGASIASVNRTATVLAALSVSNLKNLANTITAYCPREVILAADFDGEHSNTRKTTVEAFEAIKHSLSASDISCKLVFPEAITDLPKVDWNDVLVHQGPDILRKQLGVVEEGTPIVPAQALLTLKDGVNSFGFSNFQETMEGLLNAWSLSYIINAEKNELLVAYTKAEADNLNKLARLLLKAKVPLETSQTLKTPYGLRDFALLDRIRFVENFDKAGIQAGSLATIVAMQRQSVTVRLDGGREVKFKWKDYAKVDHGYAITLDELKSHTEKKAYVLLTDLKNHASSISSVYSKNYKYYWNREEYPTHEHLTQLLQLTQNNGHKITNTKSKVNKKQKYDIK